MPRMADWTAGKSRKSPAMISVWWMVSGGNNDNSPGSFRELYRTKALTCAPRSMSASTRWLAMKPPAPVTNTDFLFQKSTYFFLSLGVDGGIGVVIFEVCLVIL